MSSPYRTEGRPDDNGPELPRAELLYRTGDSERAVVPARAAIQLSILGAVVSGVVAMAGYATPAGFVLAGFVGTGIWRWRRAPEVGGILFIVDRGILTVREKASNKRLAWAKLAELLDVRLDTKEIRKVVPGQGPVPAVQFIHSQVNPSVDVARIELVLGNEVEPIRLTQQFVAHMDSVEWIGKIRSFLRKQGWVPQDEREPPDEEED